MVPFLFARANALISQRRALRCAHFIRHSQAACGLLNKPINAIENYDWTAPGPTPILRSYSNPFEATLASSKPRGNVMDSEYVFLTRETSRAVPAPAIAGSMLMQLGFVGISMAVIAILLVTKGTLGAVPAFGLGVAGIALAALAWSRSLNVLEHAGAPAVTVPATDEAATASPMMVRVNRALKHVAVPV
jgi:hypothetical protein